MFAARDNQLLLIVPGLQHKPPDKFDKYRNLRLTRATNGSIPMQVPSEWRATAIVSDEQVSQLTWPLLYEQVPVQYWSHAVHTRTHSLSPMQSLWVANTVLAI